MAVDEPASRRAPDAAPARPIRRRRRWLWRVVVVLLVAAAALTAALFIATRPTILARLVAWQLGPRVGGDVSIRRIDALGGGRYRLVDVAIEAPGWSGPAARVAFIDEAIVTIDQDAFQRLRIEPLEIDVVRGTLRLADRADDSGAMNIEALADARRGGAPAALPRILVRDLGYEMGVADDDGAFAESGATRLTGAMLPEGGDPGWFTVNLMEIVGADDRRTPGGVRLRGRFSERTLEYQLRLSRLRLDDRLRALGPLRVREWWSRLALDGEIERAVGSWTAGTAPRIEVSVADTGLTLPIEAGVPWVRLREGRMERTTGRPRLHVQHGVIVLDGDSFRLDDLSGRLVGTSTGMQLGALPFRLDMAITELPRLDWNDRTRWFDDALATAPFTLDIDLLEFTAPGPAPDGGPAGAVELPLVVADIMESLHMTDWRINIELHVARGRPTRSQDAPATAGDLTWSGTALLDNASMTYDRFMYPLHDVRAFLRFDESMVTVESFQATGPGGGDIVVRGRVAPPGPDAGFDLELVGEGLPLDATLIDALPSAARKAVHALVHAPSWKGLIDGGMIPRDAIAADDAPSSAAGTVAAGGGAELAALREERRRLRAADELVRAAAAEPTAPAPDTVASANRAARLAEIERRIALASWSLGGTIDVDISVHRDAGPDKPTEERGSFDLAGVTGVFDDFPYPFRISQGRITLEVDQVRLDPPGLDFTTAGGGTGRATGSVAFPKVDDRRVVRPDLRLVVADDRVNPALLAAIPPGAAQRRKAAATGAALGWPGMTLSNAGDLLSAASLRGELSCVATIGTTADGRIDWKVLTTLERGSAAPTDEMDAILAEEGMLWPAPLAPTDVHAVVRVDPRRVDIEEISGVIGDAALRAQGAIDLAGPTATSTFDVALDGLQLAPWMVDLAPDTQRGTLRTLWRNFDANGAIDARLHALVPTDEPAELALDIVPRRLGATLGGRPVELVALGGDIRSDLRTIWLRDLALELTSGGRPEGTIGLRGALEADAGGDGSIEGSWTDARFECGVIGEALRAVGLSELLEVARSVDPRGGFDADFAAQVVDGRSLGAHSLTVRPRDLDATVGGEPVALRFDPGAAMVVEDERLTFRDFRGVHDTGRFDLGGGATWSGRPRVDLRVAVDSEAFTPALRGLLPSSTRSALDTIKLSIDGPVTAGGDLRFERSPAEGWRSSFEGAVHVTSAAFEAAVAIDHATGDLDIAGGGGGGEPPAFELRSRLDSLRAEGRRIDRPRGALRLVDDGSILRIESVNGELFDGRVDVDGFVSVREGGPFALRIGMAGVDLAGAAERVAPPLPEGEVELPAADVDLPPAPPPARAAGSSGRFDLRFDIGGRRGDSLSHRGRGAVRVRDAAMADMPLTLQLLTLSQLMLPLRASLPMADASFYVVGDTLTFERLELQSETLRLVGEGTLDLSTLTLSTRFAPRGTLLLVSDLFQPLSNNLYVIDVTGPFSDPHASIAPLPMLGAALFGGRGNGSRTPAGPSSLADPETLVLPPLQPERRR